MTQSSEVETQLPEIDSLRISGTEVNYYFICKRKLWLYSKNLTMEQDSDDVYMGKLVHETSYRSKPRKEMMIDNLIKIDIADAGDKIHEVKLSKKMNIAHRFQLLYYLYYLKQCGMRNLVGELNYPRLRQKEEVRLLPEDEARIRQILHEIGEIKRLSESPPAEFSRLCKRCSYAELCWG